MEDVVPAKANNSILLSAAYLLLTAAGVFADTWITPGATGTILPSSASSNVGIGMNSGTPGARLHVVGGDILVDNNRYFKAKNSAGGSTTYNLLGLNASNALILGGSGATSMLLNVGASTRMTINSAGQVGIGNPTPQSMLHVTAVDHNLMKLSTINASANIVIQGNPSGNTTPTVPGVQGGGNFAFNSNGGQGGFAWGSGAPGTSGYGTEVMRLRTSGGITDLMLNGGTGKGGVLRFHENGTERATIRGDLPGDISFQTGGLPGSGPAENLRIQGNGRVGVGTANPGAKLDVVSTSASDGFALSASSNQAYKQLLVKATGTGNASEPLIKFSGAYLGGTDGAELYQSQDGTVRININGSKNSMTLAANGNVGFSHGNPQKTLHVGGAAKVDGALEVASITTHSWTVSPP